MVVLVVGIAYLSYRLFESRTYQVRRMLKGALLEPHPQKVQAPVLSTD
jgi:peptidoglycan/LPS O-acetylase OafA/YrhL